MADLGGCGEEKMSCPHQVLSPRPSSPQRIYMRTTLSRPLFEIHNTLNEAVHHVMEWTCDMNVDFDCEIVWKEPIFGNVSH